MIRYNKLKSYTGKGQVYVNYGNNTWCSAIWYIHLNERRFWGLKSASSDLSAFDRIASMIELGPHVESTVDKQVGRKAHVFC